MNKFRLSVIVIASLSLVGWIVSNKQSALNNMIRTNVEALTDDDGIVFLEYTNCRESGSGTMTDLCDGNAIMSFFQYLMPYNIPQYLDGQSAPNIGDAYYMMFLINHPDAQFPSDYKPDICNRYGRCKTFGKYGLCFDIIYMQY